MQSCLYRGHVRHRRTSPGHQFQYSTSWAYLDLSEIDDVIQSSWCLSDRRFAPASYRRVDHFGDLGLSMVDNVSQFVHQQTGLALNGPIRLLTQLRHFGVYFSPINIFYCFDERESLVAQVAEVSNTPWNERHVYVLWDGNRRPGSTERYSHAKEFHVSPFMGMDSQYEWRIAPPGETLNLSLGCDRQGDRIFQADLHLKRIEMTDGQLVRSMVRRPIAAAHIISAIYFQALRLWMKKCQFYPHPRSGQNTKQQTAQSAPDQANRKNLEQG
ncbi:MAG: DUF1365 domain-containing protein [Rubripirellula sp.]